MEIESQWGDANGYFGSVTFVHHQSKLMDYGWQAIQFNVCRAWRRSKCLVCDTGVACTPRLVAHVTCL
jgi:hypothetical protein